MDADLEDRQGGTDEGMIPERLRILAAQLRKAILQRQPPARNTQVH